MTPNINNKCPNKFPKYKIILNAHTKQNKSCATLCGTRRTQEKKKKSQTCNRA